MAKPCGALIVALLIFPAGHSSAEAAGAWNHKAVADERRASGLVGGFSPSGTLEYRAGLVYLQKRRVVIGMYTIAEVVAKGKQHPLLSRISAPPAESPQSGSPLGGLLLLSLLLGAAFWFAGRNKRGTVAPARREAAQSERERQEALTAPIVPIPAPGIAAHAGEQFYYCRANVEAIAEHHHASYVGGSAGVSMRVARGLYVRTGGSRGKRLDSISLDVDDSGTLYVSNQRVVLIGSRRTIDEPFGKIVSVDAYVDGLKLNRSNLAAVVLRTGSPGAGIILRRVMAGELGGASTPAT